MTEKGKKEKWAKQRASEPTSQRFSAAIFFSRKPLGAILTVRRHSAKFNAAEVEGRHMRSRLIRVEKI